jgi:hypothetical protein
MEVKVERKDIQAIIDTNIKLAVAKALTEDTDAVIEKIVNAALNEKSNSYSRESKLEAAIKKMIQEAAQASMDEWMKKQKPKIQKAVTNRITQEGGAFVDTIADKLVSGMASSFYVNASLRIEEE